MRQWFLVPSSIGQQVVAQIGTSYVSAVDGELKTELDAPTIEILIVNTVRSAAVRRYRGIYYTSMTIPPYGGTTNR